jgi:hypothetical protein
LALDKELALLLQGGEAVEVDQVTGGALGTVFEFDL